MVREKIVYIWIAFLVLIAIVNSNGSGAQFMYSLLGVLIWTLPVYIVAMLWPRKKEKVPPIT